MQTTKARIPVLVAAVVTMFGAMPANAAVVNPDETNTQVTIRNYNSLDVQIFAVTEAGKRYELGTVNCGSERSFSIPKNLVDSGVEFRLKIYSLARAVPASFVNNYVAAVKTQPLSVTEGEEVRLMVKDPLVASFIERG